MGNQRQRYHHATASHRVFKKLFTYDRVRDFLLDVTQQGNTAQNPMIWILIGFQVHACDVRQIRSSGLFVYRALVHPGIAASGCIDCVDMNDRHGRKEHLLSGFYKLAASAVPSGTVKVKAVYVDPFRRGLSDVIFKEPRDVIMQYNTI